MPDLAAPLNTRQIEVLQWIADGCREGVMDGHTHKTTAVALQSRKLVTVSRRRGVWRAEATEAGRYYLTHGTYPDGLWHSGPRPPAQAAIAQVTPHQPAAPGEGKAGMTPVPAGPVYGPPKPTIHEMAMALVERVVRAGGVVEVERHADRSYFDKLIAASKSVPNLPFGKQLRFQSAGWRSDERNSVVFDEDFSVRVVQVPVPVPQRVAAYHEVVAAYRDDRDRHEVSEGSFSRACRILQALAVEAERRGHKVAGRPQRSDGRSLMDGQVQIAVGGFAYGIRIREHGGSGGGPLPYSAYGSRSLPYWRLSKRHVFVPTGKLQVTVEGGYSRDGRPAEFRDTKTMSLEDRLPAVLRELEIRALEDDWRHQEEERKAERRHRRWETAMEKARQDFREARRADVLVRQPHLGS